MTEFYNFSAFCGLTSVEITRLKQEHAELVEALGDLLSDIDNMVDAEGIYPDTEAKARAILEKVKC